MALTLSILYRGPLSSCDYDCRYCPFAKRRETPSELATDRRALERFSDWIAGRHGDRLSVFFTPWGEALVRRWYQDALVRLTHLPNVDRVAIQTNLSCRLDWIGSCDRRHLGLWCSYHPSQVSRERFLGRCRELDRLGVRYSVGVVGLKENLDEIEALRRELPPCVYLWINAFKDCPNYYSESDLDRMSEVDPLVRINARHHPSLGRFCRTGESVISVDGDGDVRRCHFIPTLLGNLYDPGFERLLRTRPCSEDRCGCHIGYVHLEDLGLHSVFEGGVLERIPKDWPPSSPEEAARWPFRGRGTTRQGRGWVAARGRERTGGSSRE